LLDDSLSIHKIRKNWKAITQALTNAAKKILGDAEAVPFGSVVEGNATAASDFDVLIIAKDLPKSAWKRAQIKSKIEETAGLPPLHPIQIHLATREEAETNPIYREVLAQRLKKR